MLPWKRKELYIGNSAEELNRIRNVLDANQIPFDEVIGDSQTAREMPPRSEMMGRWGNMPVSQEITKIYVAKSDFEKAKCLLNGK